MYDFKTFLALFLSFCVRLFDLAFLSPRMGKRALLFVLLMHLFVFRICVYHFVSWPAEKCLSPLFVINF